MNGTAMLCIHCAETPSMEAQGASLGVNWMCVALGRSERPFGAHRVKTRCSTFSRARACCDTATSRRYAGDVNQLDTVACPRIGNRERVFGITFDEGAMSSLGEPSGGHALLRCRRGVSQPSPASRIVDDIVL